MKQTKTLVDHRHIHNKPFFIPIHADEKTERPSVDEYGRLRGDGGAYNHKMDGKGIYGYMCECGHSKVAIRFATKEEARELAKKYKERADDGKKDKNSDYPLDDRLSAVRVGVGE